MEENENKKESVQDEKESLSQDKKEPNEGAVTNTKLVDNLDVVTTLEQDQEADIKDLDVLTDLIHSKNISEVRKFVSDRSPIDVAYLVNDMKSETDVVFLFKAVSNEYMADVFSYLDTDQQKNIVAAFSNKEVQGLINTMGNDDLVDFVEEMPSNLVSKIIQNASPDDRKQINALLNYKEDSAGSIMTTEYVEVKNGIKAKDAIKLIRQVGKEAETISTVFVVDARRVLVGALHLEDLVFSKESQGIDKIMDDDCVSVTANTDQEDVASLMKKYDLTVIPVVNKEHRMLGIITVDDIMDVMESEQTEDLQKMAAVTPVEGDYMKTDCFKLAKSRIPWLLVLMIADTFTGLIISSFEDLILIVPVLSVFIPMLMDTGGNAGGQTTTVVTRAMSLGQITIHDYLKVLWKEFRISLITGFAVFAVNFIWIFFEINVGIIKYSPSLSTGSTPIWVIALLVSLTSYLIVIMAKTIGATLPLLARRIHLDPATMAGPVITSIVDTVSLIVYFFIAKLIIGI